MTCLAMLMTRMNLIREVLIDLNLNLPSTPNTSSEYYIECTARANDGFKNINKI